MDPEISEWGNPTGSTSELEGEYIALEWLTRGTETSKYPEESKSIETPLVVASERGLAQTEPFVARGCGASSLGVTKPNVR